ncbi:MAG: PDDEXK nuclease domain-containing protein [Kiritimatiellia bacterium]
MISGDVEMKQDFDSLVGRIQSASDALQQDALVVINRSVTARAWITGYYIVEYEQHGQDRAKYGEGLLKALTKRLNGGTFGLASLKNYKAFYLAFPKVGFPVAAYLSERFGKGYTVSSFLPDTALLQKGYTACSLSGTSLIAEKDEGSVEISPDTLFNRLSYSHIREIVRLSDDLQRTFYAFEAIRGTWIVRELRRQIESKYYERCGWSKNPHELSRLTSGKADRVAVKDFIKTDTVLEFLNLQPKDVWEEKDLEDGIIDHLQNFILEMGSGFCFEARQKKILIDDAYERIDLVFYHRILKSHVLIELKSRKFSYADAAQLSVYMAYYRKHVCERDDNPPIGILLCTEVGQEMAEYVNTFVDPALFISKYQLQLPSKEKMVDFLRQENARGGAR